MSLLMDDYLDCLSRGYGHSDKSICHDCVSNYALKSFIIEKGELRTCSYCGRRKKCTTLEDLMSPIMDGIRFMYSCPDEELPVDGGEYIGCTYSTEDIFEESVTNEIGASNEEIIGDIISLICQKTWCVANPFDVSEDEAEFNEWQRFCKLVKEKMRYVFFEAKDENGSSSSPMDILNYIASCIQKISLVTTINKKTKMYRCRMSKDEKYYSDLADFCPPPLDKTYAGRMNAQGIPVLYLALDQKTALDEVNTSERQYASVASYRVEDSFPVLDLTKLESIKVPSIFDAEGRAQISTIRFLKKFNEQISQKATNEQIDYVPTQIVTEYFRFLNRDDSSQYQGILYNSAQNEGGKCLVLFLSREDVLNRKYGIHIIPSQTMYYSKKYEWTSEEEKANLLYVTRIIEETGAKTLSEISEATGMSKATTTRIIKKLQDQGILEKKLSEIKSPLSKVL